jgi:uncharacterized membrane protein
MQLTSTGEARVRGYLFVLERSLLTFLARAQADDVVREIHSHILERAAETEPVPNEKDALERILAHLGSPHAVARAYSAEMAAEEAVVTGHVLAVGRALLHLGAAGVRGFFTVIALCIGYTVGAGLVLLAPLKLIAPENVGIIMRGGLPVAVGAVFPVPPDARIVGGYWVVPVALLVGGAVLLFTHRAARATLRRWLETRRSRGAAGLQR